MRKIFSMMLLVAGTMTLVSCDKSAEAPAQEAPTAQQAQMLRDNNIALLRNIELLKAQVEARTAARVAGRAAAMDMPMQPTVDFSMMKGQIRAALEAQGACKPWIDFVVQLFDLLGELMEKDPSAMTDAELDAWGDELLELFSKALACLEPLLAEVQGEDVPDYGTLMSNLQSFDKCMCGSEGGSIFGSSAALVYSTYGAPSTGEGYAKPSSPGGDTYSAPGSPAGEGYGAPKLFE